MPAIFRTSGTDLTDWATGALARTPPAFLHLIDGASTHGVFTSKLKAPVYNKLYWSKTSWRFRRHHINARPGSLKKSLHKFRAKRISSRRYRGGWRSLRRYSSHVNDGFFHRKTGRRIPGSHFMEAGEHAADTYMKLNMGIALAKIFKV